MVLQPACSGTHRPNPLPADTLLPPLEAFCLLSAAVVQQQKQHLPSQLLCCLPASLTAAALMTQISFYCFSLRKHKEEAASCELLPQLPFLLRDACLWSRPLQAVLSPGRSGGCADVCVSVESLAELSWHGALRRKEPLLHLQCPETCLPGWVHGEKSFSCRVSQELLCT